MEMKTASPSDMVSLVSLAKVAIFPGMLVPILATQEQQIRVFDRAWQSNGKVLIVGSGLVDAHRAIGCLTEIISFRFDDDHNAVVVIKGLYRSRVKSKSDGGFASQELSDSYPAATQPHRRQQRERLLAAFEKRFPPITENHILTPAISYDLPFGQLCDLLAASCQLSEENYACLLAETDVDQRSEVLLQILLSEQSSESKSLVIPTFTLN